MAPLVGGDSAPPLTRAGQVRCRAPREALDVGYAPVPAIGRTPSMPRQVSRRLVDDQGAGEIAGR